MVRADDQESWVGARINQRRGNPHPQPLSRGERGAGTSAGQFLVRNSSRFRIVLATTIQLANSASETPSGFVARVD
jgi:hypothetical protein